MSNIAVAAAAGAVSDDDIAFVGLGDPREPGTGGAARVDLGEGRGEHAMPTEPLGDV